VATFHKQLMEILVCPVCSSKFKVRILSSESMDGLLTCKKGHQFPIMNGLPKILTGGLEDDYSEFRAKYGEAFRKTRLYSNSANRRTSKQVQETFRVKWTSKDSMGISDDSPYKTFMRKWMLNKYGWKDENGFTAAVKGRRFILDAGAGLGREVINLAKAAPTSVVIGLEFSGCAANALKNVAPLSNAYIVQGDILQMPFAKNSFDFLLSEGVLHHTPNTREAFAKCCRVLTKGGEIAFYIYRKKGPLREFADDYLRRIMQTKTTEDKWTIANRVTSLGRALSNAHATVRIPKDIPELGIKKGDMDMQRFIYYNFLKCFWNDALPFDENAIVNFDWYAPKHAHRHTEAEIREWCKENSIEIVWFFGEDSGYSVRGIKS